MRENKSLIAQLSAEQWAMESEALAALFVQLQGLNLDGVDQARLFTSDDQADGAEGYRLNGDVGVVDVTGPILKSGGLLAMLIGGSPLPRIIAGVKAADADPKVKEIALNVDSPGGVAAGLYSAGEVIRSASKKTTSYVTGYAASAGYWLASACDEVVAEPTSLVGSVGAIATRGIPRQRDDAVTFTSATAPLKNIDPRSEPGRKMNQEQTDELGEVFLETVARYRGVSRDEAAERFGRGAPLMAKAALEAGMIDRIGVTDMDLTAQLAAAQERLEALESENGELIASRDSLAAQLDTANTAAETTREELTAAQQAAADADAALNTAVGELDTMRAAQEEAERLLAAEQCTAQLDELSRTGRLTVAERLMKSASD